MNLLAGKIYDPAAAVSKATSSLLAMTALDTTNLRLVFTVPPSGIVRVRISTTITGAATLPQILLGVLQSATVIGRMAPMYGVTNLATTSHVKAEVDFVVSGLVAGASLTWDAAYAVQVIVASTNIKYGGPNDATGADAWGGLVFEIYDVCPIFLINAVPTASADSKVSAVKTQTDKLAFTVANQVDANVKDVNGTAQTARDLGAQLDAAVSSRMATFTLPTNFASLVIDANGRVDISKWLGATVNALITGRVDANAGVVGDKTGYALTQAFPANFATLLIDVNGRIDLSKVLGVAINALIAGRLDVNAQVVGDKTGYTAATVQDKTGYTVSTNQDKTGYTVSTNQDKIGYGLAVDAIDASAVALSGAQEIANTLLDLADSIETGVTARQALRLMAAIILGNATGLDAASGTAVFKGANAPAATRVSSLKDGSSRSNTLTP